MLSFPLPLVWNRPLVLRNLLRLIDAVCGPTVGKFDGARCAKKKAEFDKRNMLRSQEEAAIALSHPISDDVFVCRLAKSEAEAVLAALRH